MNRKHCVFSRRRILYGALALGIVAVATWAVKEFRFYVLPRRFAVVETDKIYRGGRQTLPVLKRILRKHNIRTIINLDDKLLEKDEPWRPGADRYVHQKNLAKALGIQYRGFIWNGSGVGPFDEYDAVADILATTSSQPVFVHCAAGKKRTNAAIAAYLIRYRAYSFDQVVQYLERNGLSPRRKRELIGHLSRYYEYAMNNPRPAFSSSTVTTDP